MAKKTSQETGKLRTRDHVIADLAVNHVERQVLLCGYTIEKHTRDYGIDLAMVTFNPRGEVESGLVLLQVKATDRTSRSADVGELTFRVQRAHVVGWIREILPIILVVYDAKEDRAYWLHVQAYFKALEGFDLFRAGRTITLHIPNSNVLDQAAVRSFAALRDQLYRRVRGGEGQP